MSKPSYREDLLKAGRKVMFQSGYRGASVRDICAAAGVPQGCFTNHFRSKEAFAEEVLELFAGTRSWSRAGDKPLIAAAPDLLDITTASSFRQMDSAPDQRLAWGCLRANTARWHASWGMAHLFLCIALLARLR
jgi:AcrR family transcriptional regulator